MIQGVAAKWSFSSLSANKGVNQQFIGLHPYRILKGSRRKRHTRHRAFNPQSIIVY